MSRWGGIYGLIVDSLLEVELVTATGELVKASKTENPELFWGIRGAGINFGIVVKATFRIYDQINNGDIALADMILPYDKAMDCVKVLKSLEDNQPANLSIALGAMWNEQAGGVSIPSDHLTTCVSLRCFSHVFSSVACTWDQGQKVSSISSPSSTSDLS